MMILRSSPHSSVLSGSGLVAGDADGLGDVQTRKRMKRKKEKSDQKKKKRC